MTDNQAISRRSFTHTLTFAGKPTEETRKALMAAGFQFDAKSRQWYRREETPEVMTEEEVVQLLAI